MDWNGWMAMVLLCTVDRLQSDKVRRDESTRNTVSNGFIYSR